jgi:hypothetical protein
MLFRTLLAIGLVLALAGLSRADEEGEAIIQKAIKAHGGAQNLAKLKNCHTKSQGQYDPFVPSGFVNPGQQYDFKSDTVVQLPGKIRVISDYWLGMLKVSSATVVLNGDDAWLKANGKTTLIQDQALEEQKATIQEFMCSALTPLLEKNSYDLTALPDKKVKGKAAHVVSVKPKGHPEIILYFDKDSGLLVKTERRAYNAGTKKEGLQEIFYSNYKDQDGVKCAMASVGWWDGKQLWTSVVTEIEFLKTVPKHYFEEP